MNKLEAYFTIKNLLVFMKDNGMTDCICETCLAFMSRMQELKAILNDEN